MKYRQNVFKVCDQKLAENYLVVKLATMLLRRFHSFSGTTLLSLLSRRSLVDSLIKNSSKLVHQVKRREEQNMKYILVTGGVISGVGKGVIASSFGTLLNNCDIAVTSLKIDPYINIDAGTFSPYEHGENLIVFLVIYVLLFRILFLCAIVKSNHNTESTCNSCYEVKIHCLLSNIRYHVLMSDLTCDWKLLRNLVHISINK